MSTIDLKCEALDDDYFYDGKIEFIDNEEAQPAEPEGTAECGRIILNPEKNSWSYKCLFCESLFSEISEFMEHITDSHIKREDDWESEPSNYAYNLEITPVDQEQENLKIEIMTDSEHFPAQHTETKAAPQDYPHKCEFCEKTFRYRSKLRDHITIHTGELPFKCNQCPKAFRTNDILRFHRAIHNEGRSFKCFHCDQTFNQKRYLQMHLKYHLGEKTFPCTICGKNHRTSGQLKVHMTKHTLKKDHICEVCGACYRLRQHLVIHMKQKHENKREFRCDKCDKAFNTITFLNHHQRSHSKERNHICNVCGIGFVWRKNLLEHIKLHTGEKNYKCEICGKAFAQKSGLISHMKTHAS